MTRARRADEYPDLPEIMDYGIGLTQALAFWSEMMNTSSLSPSDWRVELQRRFGAPIRANLH